MQRAVVTGGTGAIGTEICRQLLAAGYAVVAIGHPDDAGRQDAWRGGFSADAAIDVCYGDLADADAAGAAMQRADTLLERVDVLVNAAGITRDARFSRMSLEQWRSVIASNLDSVFHCCKAVFEPMCQRAHGRIINIASVNGQRGQFGQANYAAAKAGMHGLTMTLAQEGARYGVTANTVSPGYIQTPMTASIKPEALQAVVAQIPMGRMGAPQDIARAVCFLADDDAGYVTGANIPVNGGLYMSA